MSRSKEEMILLDEKIARIRKKNEEILRRKQLIDEEIELAKKQNAVVNTKSPKFEENDFGPSLYSDTLDEERSSKPLTTDVIYPNHERKKTGPDNSRVNETAWRAERKQIDNERITRQKGDSGWRREWDADKIIDDDARNSERSQITTPVINRRNLNDNACIEFRNSRFSGLSNRSRMTSEEDDWDAAPPTTGTEYQSNRYQRPSQRILTTPEKKTEYRSPNLRRSIQSRDENNSGNNNFYSAKIKIETSERHQTHQNNVKTLSDHRQMVANNNLSNTRSRQQRLSWEDNRNSADVDRVNLKEDVKNIVIRIGKDDSVDRTIEVTNECKVLANTGRGITRFDEESSKDIKDCVAKMTTLRALRSQNEAYIPTKQNSKYEIPLNKINASNYTKIKNQSPNTKYSNSAIQKPLDRAYGSTQDSWRQSKQKNNDLKENSSELLRQENENIVQDDNDEEWEDLSEEEWEDVFEEE